MILLFGNFNTQSFQDLTPTKSLDIGLDMSHRSISSTIFKDGLTDANQSTPTRGNEMFKKPILKDSSKRKTIQEKENDSISPKKVSYTFTINDTQHFVKPLIQKRRKSLRNIFSSSKS